MLTASSTPMAATSLSSHAGEGTTVTVFLPTGLPSEPPAAGVDRPSHRPAFPGIQRSTWLRCSQVPGEAVYVDRQEAIRMGGAQENRLGSAARQLFFQRNWPLLVGRGTKLACLGRHGLKNSRHGSRSNRSPGQGSRVASLHAHGRVEGRRSHRCRARAESSSKTSMVRYLDGKLVLVRRYAWLGTLDY